MGIEALDLNNSYVYLMQLVTLITVFTVAVMSPGPDFVMAVRNSVVHSRRTGIFTAFGFGFGILVHVAYTIGGFAAIISQSVLLFNLIKYAGAGYLIYIGLQALRSKGMSHSTINQALQSKKKRKVITDGAALRSGFLTNALNPKATLFFLAIFSQIIRPETPISWQILYGIVCALIVTSWFCLVSYILTHKKIRNKFMSSTKWIDRGCGILMIGLGIKVALSSQ